MMMLLRLRRTAAVRSLLPLAVRAEVGRMVGGGGKGTAAVWVREVGGGATGTEETEETEAKTMTTTTTMPQQPRFGGERIPSIDFDNAQRAYSDVSTGEMVRAWLVLRICSFRPLVTHADFLLGLSNRVLGKGLTTWLVRKTLFDHFCAGEDQETIRPTVQQLEKRHIGSILDYAAEEALHGSDEDKQENATPPAIGEGAPESESQGDGAQRLTDEQRYVEYVDKRVRNIQAMLPFETACDERMETFMKCIDAVHNVCPTGFAAIKLTGLAQPRLLKDMSSARAALVDLFEQFDEDKSGVVTYAEFKRAFPKWFPKGSEEERRALLARLDPYKTGEIDYVTWVSTLELAEVNQLAQICDENNYAFRRSWLPPEEVQLMYDLYTRVHNLATYAQQQGVRIMVDAEQTYLQPAIDNVVAILSQKYNVGQYPVIFNTYQMYLKDSWRRLIADMDRAKRMNYRFAAKIVRGAYMEEEGKLAALKNQPSPVHDTIEDTHANYNQAIKEILTRMANGDAVEVMVASHNQQSIELAVQTMQELNLTSDAPVYFGQLLGMADHLTHSAAHAQLNAYKYVPYGQVDETIQYLVRRAQENSSLLGGAVHERSLIRSELMGRLFGRSSS